MVAPGRTPRRGPGHLQWDFGGWFGSQVGACVWMLILGCLVVSRDPVAGAVCLGAFAIAQGVGTWLWSRRHAWEPHRACQVELAVIGIVSVATAIVVNARGAMRGMEDLTTVDHIPLWILLVVPAVMLFLYLRDRSGRGDPV